MKLNHPNLTVSDVPRTRELLETYFGQTTLMTREDDFAAMTDDDGSALTSMEGEQVSYPGNFHIGFMLSGRPPGRPDPKFAVPYVPSSRAAPRDPSLRGFSEVRLPPGAYASRPVGDGDYTVAEADLCQTTRERA